MVTKKKEVAPAKDIDTSTLLEKVVSSEEIEAIVKENESLKEQLNEALEKSAFTTVEGVTLEGRDIKTEMLIALLPQVDINYAKTNAERALAAVDEIMKAWGLDK